jgi:hypothetical protein
MQMQKRHNCFYLIVLVLLLGCKEKFEPNLPIVPQGYLVVEGFINAQGPTQIRLSRTTQLNQKNIFKAELNASIKVEGEDNSSFTLLAMAGGLYSGTASINAQRRYRLRIRTKDTKEYVSEFISVKITPPIDSVSWEEEDRGVQVYINSHDPQNKTIYYRYDYDETWEINSAYPAEYMVDRILPRQIIIRPTNSSDPQIFYCWKYDTSKTILLGSSAKLENDIIYKQPINLIPTEDEKIGVRYSIQVRQYALDKEGFQFMEQMKKNTEALGTIFDPQPSLLKGNIRSLSDPNELVLGYVMATTMQQQRIFVSRQQLANRGFNVYAMCDTVRVKNIYDSLASHIPPRWPHYAFFEGLSLIPVAYLISDAPCIDCRLRGGINVKPSFW